MNERQVLELFASVRLAQFDNGEPGDVKLVNRGAIKEEEEEEEDRNEYTPLKRYSYSREHKLAAIDYFQTTWRELKDGTHERLSVRYASKRLKITRKLLRDWVASKESIQAQKRGSFRSRKSTPRPQEPELERQLNSQFEKAREKGRKISYKWMIRHAKVIYEELYPERIVRHESGKKTYLNFRFSSGWYTGFRRRYCISLRCGTKRA